MDRSGSSMRGSLPSICRRTFPVHATYRRVQREKTWGRFMSRDFSGKDLVIYCSGPGCPLSNELADALAGHGIKNVKVLPDGWAGWYEAGFPIEGEK